MKIQVRQKTKLLENLEGIGKNELIEFKKWLQSPWANSNKKLIELLDFLLTDKKITTGNLLDKERLFSKLFPNKSYNNRTLNNLLSACNKQLDRFISHTQLDKDFILELELKKRFFASKKLQSTYEECLEEQLKFFEKNHSNEQEDFIWLSNLYSEKYFQASEKFRYEKSDILNNSDLLLDQFYALIKARNWHEAKDRSKIIGAPQLPAYDGKLMVHLEKSTKIAALSLYRMRLERTGSITWNQFELFKNRYFELFEELSEALKQDFFYFTVNDIVLLTKSIEEKALEELLRLYKFGLQHNLMFVNGQMTFVTYNNVLILSSYLDDFLFAEEFKQKYLKKLPQDYRYEAELWSDAHLAFMKGNYENSLNILVDIRFKHPLFQLHGRITQLKCNLEWLFEEPDHYERFESYCKATLKYINRHEHFSLERNAPYRQLVKFASKIAEAKIQNTVPKKLKEKIKKEKNLLAKPWIKKMLQKLEH
jgi:hypothetical protein